MASTQEALTDWRACFTARLTGQLHWHGRILSCLARSAHMLQ